VLEDENRHLSQHAAANRGFAVLNRVDLLADAYGSERRYFGD